MGGGQLRYSDHSKLGEDNSNIVYHSKLGEDNSNIVYDSKLGEDN